MVQSTASIGLVTRVSEMLDEGVQKDEHSALAKELATAGRARPWPGAGRRSAATGIVLDYGIIRHFADSEPIYSYDGTREMNTLIVGRAITGLAAFV